MASKMSILVLQALLFLTFTAAVELGRTCGVCDKSACPSTDECQYGTERDACDCCDVCLRGLGELCDIAGSPKTFGSCGEYLECATRTDIKESKEAVCVCKEEGKVCGSDQVTYSTLCHLLDQAHTTPDLNVKERSPCVSAPRIRSRPEDKERPLGGILVLDCEAEGFPVPEITWRLSKLDGSSHSLPGDDPSYAVQVRGGPESNMVTGWVQIMKITDETLGIYTCVATNEEGQAEASATVSAIRDEENEV